MSEPIFNDKSLKPNDNMLEERLGKNFKHFLKIRESASKLAGETTEEWKFYGKKYGWQLKTFKKKRNLFFIIPTESFFKIVFIFGDKAVEEIKRSTISEKIITELVNTKKYMEGRGIAIEVKNAKVVSDIKKLIEIKIKH